MTDRFIIQVDDAQAQRRFGQLIARGSDLSGLMAEIGELLTKSSQARFDTSTAPDGSKWAPLSRSTYEKLATGKNLTSKGRLNKRGAGVISGRKPLVDTGTMRDNINSSSGPNFVEINASAKQARWHQEGTRRLPARPFIGLSRDDIAGIDRAVVARLDL